MDTREERLERRIADLYADDRQFADARPSEAISAAIDQPGLRLPQIVRTVMEGYADRPALAQRAIQFVNDPQTGRTSVDLLPRFETTSYRELWDRVGAVATALAGGPSPSVRPGDRVCVLVKKRIPATQACKNEEDLNIMNQIRANTNQTWVKNH